MTRKQRAAVYIVVPLIIFLITCWTYYAQTLIKGTDTYTHMNLSLSLDMVLAVSHCGWHFVFWLFYACLPIEPQHAAAVATGVFNAVTAVSVLWMCERFFATSADRLSPLAGRAVRMRGAGSGGSSSSDYGSAAGSGVSSSSDHGSAAGSEHDGSISGKLLAATRIIKLPTASGAGWLTVSAITLAALLVGPLYLRFYNNRYYLGQGTPNVWHNPTTIAARATMFLIGILTVDYWNCDPEKRVWAAKSVDGDQNTAGQRRFLKDGIKARWAYQLVLTILLLCSTLAKPSYLMAYAPAVFLFLVARLIKGRGRNFFRIVGDNLYFIPSLMLFLSQYIRIYLFGGVRNKKASVVIAWMKTATQLAPNPWISLLLRMAFPFLIVVLWWKYIYKDRLFQLIFVQYLVALLTYLTLAEQGTRERAGNFGWGHTLCCSFLWVWSVMFFFREWKEQGRSFKDMSLQDKLRFGIPLILLIWHLLAGITSLRIYV